MSKKLEGNKSIRAAVLQAMAEEGDGVGVVAHIARMLRRPGDAESRMAVRLLLRLFRTGAFSDAPKGRPSGPVMCQRTPSGELEAVAVPRNEIALSVFLRLEPDPKPPAGRALVVDQGERRRLLVRRKLSKAVHDTARFFGISQNVVRDCFEEHCDELLQFGDAIKWS